ncbi:MAG: hypothetical protein WAM82_01760 [Thermoanaerobaculia bacterium]
MKNKLILLALLIVPAALHLAPGTARADIRYCCTPQQIAACQATGGTTSCRTGVCQCLF